MAKLLPSEKQSYGTKNAVVGVDVDAKEVKLASGSSILYDSLISTIPLDIMCRWVGRDDWADRLSHSSSHIVGLGIRGVAPHGKKCWLYYPEDDCPFYRTTVFSHYAKKNCPEDSAKLPTLCTAGGDAPGASEPQEGPYWSLMFEISESQKFKPVNQEPVKLPGAAGTWPKVVQETIQGAINTQLIQPGNEIVSIYYRRLEHGYPTPSLARDGVLAEALPYLQSKGIWNRGRFGSYKYEVANQDHSLMLGVECADNVLFGAKELTLAHPDIVNAKKNTELLYLAKPKAKVAAK